MVKAKITEIFPSVQGEGLYVGEPQIFVRFAKCNLKCDYCDTVKTGGKEYDPYELLGAIGRLEFYGAARTVAVTGGEPLLYADFLKVALPLVRKSNFRVYLETNGTLPGGLLKVLDLVDVIAMDMKMPSSLGGRAFWTQHRDFLGAAGKKTVFVKAVITPKTTFDEIRKAVSIIDDINPSIPMVLQPVMPAGKIKKRVRPERLMEFQKLAKRLLDDVRIIPQMHKILGVK